MRWKRRIQAIEEPFPEPILRRAIAAYYGMVTFLDEQIGRVLDALEGAGLSGTTRVVYSTDHGEMLGDHGLWWKSVMFEGARGSAAHGRAGRPRRQDGGHPRLPGRPLPHHPGGHRSRPEPEDAGLPGASLLRLAGAGRRPAGRLLRVPRQPLLHRVLPRPARAPQADPPRRLRRLPPQLFDLRADPAEAHDLASDPAHAPLLAELQGVLRSIVDPRGGRRRPRRPARRIDAAGACRPSSAPAPASTTPRPGGLQSAPPRPAGSIPPRRPGDAT